MATYIGHQHVSINSTPYLILELFMESKTHGREIASKLVKWGVVRKVKSLSRARLLVTPWTAAYQAPPSMGFSRQEYWSGVPLPSPDLFSDPKNQRGGD